MCTTGCVEQCDEIRRYGYHTGRDDLHELQCARPFSCTAPGGKEGKSEPTAPNFVNFAIVAAGTGVLGVKYCSTN